MFPDLTRTFNIVFFLRYCLGEVFQTLHDYNCACGLLIHAIFDDLEVTGMSSTISF